MWTDAERLLLGLDTPPIADSTTPGLIQVGANLSINSDGVLSAPAPPPIASTTQVGTVQVGGNLSVTESGVLSAPAPPPIASTTQIGTVQVGDNLSVTAAGVLSGPAPPPVASTTQVGTVQVGSNLSVTAAGVLSGPAPPPVASTTQVGTVQVGDNLSVTAAGVLSAQGGTFTPSVSSSTAIQSVGGLPTSALQTASDITNKTFSELFNVLLFPTQYPSHTNPTITLSGITNNAVFEFNSTQSFTISYTADPGKITLSGVDQQYNASDETVSSGVVRYTGAISSVVVNDFDGSNHTFTENSTGGNNTYSGFSNVGNFVITDYDFDNSNLATTGVEVKLTIKWANGPTPIDSTGAAFTSNVFPYSSTTGLAASAKVFAAYYNYQGTSTTNGKERMKKNATQDMPLTKHASLQYLPNNNTNLSEFIFLNYTHVDGPGTRHRFYLSQLLYNYWTSSKTLQIYGPNGDGTGWSAEAMANFSTTTVSITDDYDVSVTYVLIEFTSSANTGPKKYKIGFI